MSALSIIVNSCAVVGSLLILAPLAVSIPKFIRYLSVRRIEFGSAFLQHQQRSYMLAARSMLFQSRFAFQVMHLFGTILLIVATVLGIAV